MKRQQTGLRGRLSPRARIGTGAESGNSEATASGCCLYVSIVAAVMVAFLVLIAVVVLLTERISIPFPLLAAGAR